VGSITPRTGNGLAGSSGGQKAQAGAATSLLLRGQFLNLAALRTFTLHEKPRIGMFDMVHLPFEGIEALHELADNVVAALSRAGLTACRRAQSRGPRPTTATRGPLVEKAMASVRCHRRPPVHPPYDADTGNALKPYDRLVQAADLTDAPGRAINDVNDTLRRRIREEPELAGMDTTMVAVLRSGDTAVLANVGDSRAYLMRDFRDCCCAPTA
jgi:hypothetical protein